MNPLELTLEAALKLLSLPREIGRHPEDGEPIVAGLGRFGPYVKHGKDFRSLPPEDDVITIGLNRAVVLLAEPKSGRRRGPEPLRIVGQHPEDGADIKLYKGRYGPYVAHGGINASLPGDADPMTLPLDEAVRLLAERAEKIGHKPRRKSATAKAAGSKTVEQTDSEKPPNEKAPKKSATKKSTAKKKRGKKQPPPASEAAPRPKRAAAG